MNRLFLVTILFVAIFTQSLFAMAETESKLKNYSEKDIKDNYQKLLSDDYYVRYKAISFFCNFKKDELNERIVSAAINLYKKEIERGKKVDDFFAKGGHADNLPKEIAYHNNEDYGSYELCLCSIVGKSQDKSILPMLINNCLQPNVIINFGDDAVDPTMYILKTADNPIRKISVIFVLAEMLKPKKEGYVASGEIRNKIKNAIIEAVSDKDGPIAGVAIRALGESGDKDVIPLLENLAQQDQYYLENKDKSTGKIITRYPNREEAEKALQKIKGQ